MLRHAIQRLLMAVPVMFGVLLVGFLLMQVVPTDPAVVRAGPTATQDVVDAIRPIRGGAGASRRSAAMCRAR